MFRIAEHCQAKRLRQATTLPITFRRRSNSDSDGGLDRVVRSVTGVTDDVGGCSGMTGGAGGGACRKVISVAGSGVGGKCGGARLAHR